MFIFLKSESAVIFETLLHTAVKYLDFHLSEGSSMTETTSRIMTFLEWHFALASLSKGPGFETFLHHSTEVRGKSEDLQAKQFEFSWLSGLLCLQNITEQARSQRRHYRSFGNGPREGHPGSRIFSLLLGYLFAVKSVYGQNVLIPSAQFHHQS